MQENYIANNKIFYHSDRIKAYLSGGLVRPISVKLRLTDRCNLNCYYCSYKGNLNNGDMAKTDTTYILDKLKLLGVRSIVLTGGEPTCYPGFKDIVKTMKEFYKFDIALITNGVIYPDVLKYLTWVRFSLDTVNKDSYIKSKGVDSLDSVMSNIKRAVKEKDSNNLDVTIGVQAIVNRDNFDYQFKEIKRVIKFASNTGADYMQIRPLENYKYTEIEIAMIKENLRKIKNVDYGIKVMCTDYKWSEVFNGGVKSYKGCPSADFIGLVDVKGDFYMCCAMTNDPTAKYGNLVTDSPAKIFANRIKIQKEFDYRKCTLACQGSLLNKTLANFKNIKHSNFI